METEDRIGWIDCRGTKQFSSSISILVEPLKCNIIRLRWHYCKWWWGCKRLLLAVLCMRSLSSLTLTVTVLERMIERPTKKGLKW